MTEPDRTMVRIGEGIGLGQRGQRAAARSLFAQVWTDIGGDDGDPLHRCAIAHSMADVQDDVGQELQWDLRALDAANLLTDERVTRAGIAGSAAAFLPSLHLNIGDCYRRLGLLDAAKEHHRRGLEAFPALVDDGSGSMVRQGLDRLGARLHGG